MTLDTRAYLNLSALAYMDFNKSLTGLTIKELIERRTIPKDDLNNKPELSALQDPSNPLRSFVLLDQSPPVIYRRTVTQRGLTRTVYHEYEANLLI